MGESSATRLRGESITDVIFNGSSVRKPVGTASVELLFDNTETTLEGQYAKYAEISIRREVSRDGISNYYLNGTRCRRKDVQGVFLGTGLGPRSYSIIEQGMISRLIEAKPEEVRVFLEEAAGISKYKERRRETSNRIKHTKENLDRLKDVLELKSRFVTWTGKPRPPNATAAIKTKSAARQPNCWRCAPKTWIARQMQQRANCRNARLASKQRSPISVKLKRISRTLVSSRRNEQKNSIRCRAVTTRWAER